MTDQAPHKGSDLSNGKVDIGDGVLIENRLRLGAVIWLEEKVGKSVMQYLTSIDPNTMMFKEIQPLFVALIMQAHPNVTEEEATSLSLRVDLGAIPDILPTIMHFAVKNSPSPEVDLTEQAPATQE